MKTLDVRRHSIRKTGPAGGSQLSQQGVNLARMLGATLGPYDLVVASVIPRARETAIAMGFAVDHELLTLQADEAVYAEVGAARSWEQPQPFATIAATIAQGGAAARYAQALAAVWRDLVIGLPDGGVALVIGHSGDLEMGLVACLPNADHAAWGGLFGPCEGVRLRFGGTPERWLEAELLRL